MKYLVECSVKNYILKVHIRCFFVTIVALVIPLFLYEKVELYAFKKLMLTCILTTVSVLVTSYTIGLDKEMRHKINNLIRQKLIRHA